jgi:hypothetical protein
MNVAKITNYQGSYPQQNYTADLKLETKLLGSFYIGPYERKQKNCKAGLEIYDKVLNLQNPNQHLGFAISIVLFSQGLDDTLDMSKITSTRV